MKVLGWAEEVTVCDCCGKSKLVGTVGLELENGDIVHYGRNCAANAIMGSKGAKNASLIESKAKAISKISPVVDAVRVELSNNNLAAALERGNMLGKKIYINGSDVIVSGFKSWGNVYVYWNGGNLEIPIPENCL